LKAGDQLSIERVTREVKDPATGKVLRRMSSQVATVRCDDIDDGSAVCKITSGAGVKVGDMAKTTTE
jgi:hypothetical protein